MTEDKFSLSFSDRFLILSDHKIAIFFSYTEKDEVIIKNYFKSKLNKIKIKIGKIKKNEHGSNKFISMGFQFEDYNDIIYFKLLFSENLDKPDNYGRSWLKWTLRYFDTYSDIIKEFTDFVI